MAAAAERRSPSVAGLLAVFAVALALRAAYLLQLHDSLLFTVLFGDGQQYDEWARAIAAGDWMGHEVFYQAPLYPYFLAAIYTIGDHSLPLVRAVQALLGSASCVLLAFAGTRLISRRAGLCAGLLLAAYPPAIFFDGLIQKSSLDLLLTTVVLALLAAFLRRQRVTLLAALGVAVGALTLNRENARVMYGVLVPWLGLSFPRVSALRRGVFVAVFLAASACVLLPVAWRNYRVGGELFVSTSQLGPNLFIGNHPGANGLYAPLVPGRGDARAERADAVRLAEEAEGRRLTPREVSDYWTGRALAFVAEQPAAWLRLMARKAFLTFHALELADSESIDVFAGQAVVLRALRAVLGFGVLFPLAVLGIWATRRDWRRLAVLYALLLALAASVALFYVFARYRFPMVPILAVFAGAALASAPDMVRALRRRGGVPEWAPGLLLAGSVAVAANWPLPQYRDDEITWFDLGLTLLEQGRTEPAAHSLEEAVRLKPDFGLAHYQLGRALAAQGRIDLAERELALAVRLLPDLPDAHYGYATLLLRRDVRSEDGLAHLRRAAALVPDTAAVHIDLGRALARRGELGEAARELRAGIGLAPEDAGAANDLAWILVTSPDASVRNGAEAVALLERLRGTAAGETPEVLDTLAAAYAETGRFAAAVETATRAEALARSAGKAPLAETIEARARLYRQGLAFRQGLPAPPPPSGAAPAS